MTVSTVGSNVRKRIAPQRCGRRRLVPPAAVVSVRRNSLTLIAPYGRQLAPRKPMFAEMRRPASTMRRICSGVGRAGTN